MRNGDRMGTRETHGVVVLVIGTDTDTDADADADDGAVTDPTATPKGADEPTLKRRGEPVHVARGVDVS